MKNLTGTLLLVTYRFHPGVGGWVAKITTTTILYINPDAMVHVLLTLNEPLLQRSAHMAPLVCPSPQSSLATGPRFVVPSTDTHDVTIGYIPLLNPKPKLR